MSGPLTGQPLSTAASVLDMKDDEDDDGDGDGDDDDDDDREDENRRANLYLSALKVHRLRNSEGNSSRQRKRIK